MKTKPLALPKNSTTVRFDALPLLFKGLSAVSGEMAARTAQRIFLTPPKFPVPEAEKAFLATGHRSHIKDGNGRLVAWSWGDGPTVFLLHGWGGRAGQFHRIIPPLVESGFSVVAFDAPGHGETGGRHPYITEFARALRLAVEWAGPAHAVVAHSMGAAAAALALDQGLKAQRAVFIASPTSPEDFLGQLGAKLALPAAVRARLQDLIALKVGLPWEKISVVDAARYQRTPLLVIHDRDDANVPFASAREIVGAWPEARLLATEGWGHTRILRAPETIGAVVNFLRSGNGQ